ncbi:MAG: hypothetical protein FH758_13495 [Firmicutes bacterium]|nr:hypothetical protein [Bacillota bacterium]
MSANIDNIKLRKHVHKINNMVTIIKGNAELLSLEDSNSDEVKDILMCCEQIQEIIQRICDQEVGDTH